MPVKRVHQDVRATRKVAAGQAVVVRSKIQHTNNVTAAGRETTHRRTTLTYDISYVNRLSDMENGMAI
jgi:hypothetical protein